MQRKYLFYFFEYTESHRGLFFYGRNNCVMFAMTPICTQCTLWRNLTCMNVYRIKLPWIVNTTN